MDEVKNVYKTIQNTLVTNC